jgi:hypothetical protein
MSYDTQAINRVREHARKQERDLNGFDFNAPAELFPGRRKKGGSHVTYKRFDTAAEALRFVVEEMSATIALGAYLEVAEVRFGLQEMRYLYDSEAYPLKRPAPAN